MKGRRLALVRKRGRLSWRRHFAQGGGRISLKPSKWETKHGAIGAAIDSISIRAYDVRYVRTLLGE